MSALARISEIGSITDCECVETGASIYSLTILVSKIRLEAFCVSGLWTKKTGLPLLIVQIYNFS